MNQAYCEAEDRPSGTYRRVDMLTLPVTTRDRLHVLRDQAQRVLEEAVFRLWVGAGFAVGAIIAVRWLIQPDTKPQGSTLTSRP